MNHRALRITPAGHAALNRSGPGTSAYLRLRRLGLDHRTAWVLAVNGYGPVRFAERQDSAA